jgi:hypothetical protein
MQTKSDYKSCLEELKEVDSNLVFLWECLKKPENKDNEAEGLINDYKKLISKSQELSTKLKNIASHDSCKAESGDNWHELISVSNSTFSSQGWGADTYAKNAANLHADKAEFYGIKSRVDFKNQGDGLHLYVVMVSVNDQVDIDIILKKPSVPLKDFVQSCYNRGVNPRVYQPYLPYDYEEKNGIKLC